MKWLSFRNILIAFSGSVLLNTILADELALAQTDSPAQVPYVPYNANSEGSTKALPNASSELSKQPSKVIAAPVVSKMMEAPDEGKIIHLLNRITFGPTAKDIASVKQMGINAYLEQQLHPQTIELTDELKQISHYIAMSESPAYLFQNYVRPRQRAANDVQKFPNNDQAKAELQGAQEINRRLFEDFTTAHIARATFSPAQLQEVMTDFWFNHFNIALSKSNQEEVWVGSYEETAIRPFALGKFRDILGATAHHAAMLDYLDNRLNTAPHSLLASGQYEGINENYARELMELHTLGVDGGYTQKDVQELARVLTGLGLPPNLFGPNVPKNVNQSRLAQKGRGGLNNGARQPASKGHGIWERPGYDKQWQRAAELQQAARNQPATEIQLMEQAGDTPEVQETRQAIFDSKFGSYFDPRRHDFGKKVLLRHEITGKGEQEIEEALDILAKQPATAHHISFQLAQYFVADKPPAALVNRMAKRFIDSDGSIPAVLETLFHSPEFWDTKFVHAKFKSPYRYLVSALRATDADLGPIGPNLGTLKQLGEPLFQCLTPDGYKNTKEMWQNPDSLLYRIDFAAALGSGHYPGAQPQMRDPAVLEECIGPTLSARTKEVVMNSPESLKMTLLLGSPDFMRY